MGDLPGVPTGETPEGPRRHDRPKPATQVQTLRTGDPREYRSA